MREARRQLRANYRRASVARLHTCILRNQTRDLRGDPALAPSHSGAAIATHDDCHQKGARIAWLNGDDFGRTFILGQGRG